jgi:hypothetical protein
LATGTGDLGLLDDEAHAVLRMSTAESRISQRDPVIFLDWTLIMEFLANGSRTALTNTDEPG